MCSYCGCDSIELIGRFLTEDVEIINATGMFRAAVAHDDGDSLEPAGSAAAICHDALTGSRDQEKRFRHGHGATTPTADLGGLSLAAPRRC